MMTPFIADRNTIHCDMDDVMVWFKKFILDTTGREFSNYKKPKHDAELWAELTKVERMFYQMPPTPYAKRLWDEVKAVGSRRQLLTALPRDTTLATAHDDKRQWAQEKHHDDVFGEYVHVEIGPFAHDKWKHAKPGDILIDDNPDNIAQWVTLGNGIGIYHHDHDIERTIALLRHYTGR